MSKDYVSCPFCRETDFDLIGLKAHLLKGWCQPFEDTDDIYPPKRPAAETCAECGGEGTVSYPTSDDTRYPCPECTAPPPEASEATPKNRGVAHD